jgi:hypothetical protein
MAEPRLSTSLASELTAAVHVMVVIEQRCHPAQVVGRRPPSLHSRVQAGGQPCGEVSTNGIRNRRPRRRQPEGSSELNRRVWHPRSSDALRDSDGALDQLSERHRRHGPARSPHGTDPRIARGLPRNHVVAVLSLEGSNERDTRRRGQQRSGEVVLVHRVIMYRDLSRSPLRRSCPRMWRVSRGFADRSGRRPRSGSVARSLPTSSRRLPSCCRAPVSGVRPTRRWPAAWRLSPARRLGSTRRVPLA